MSPSREQLLKDLQKNYKNSTPKTKRMWRCVGMLLCVYACVFFIPDFAWIQIGIHIPNLDKYPKIMQTTVSLAKFPVSVYVFWIMIPFFFVINTLLIAFAILNEDQYRKYLVLKYKMHKKNKYLIYGPIGFILLTIFFWYHPHLLGPNGPVSKNFDIYNSKICFVSWKLVLIRDASFYCCSDCGNQISSNQASVG
jgi:hypothetical protein